MSRSLRVKHCHRCQQIVSVLYRVKFDESGEWIFVCERCWSFLSQDNPHYVYGGTWKAQKKA